MEIYIIYGAHKTATTFFQGTLEINSQELIEKNVLYIPIEELREKFTNTIFKEEKWSKELKSKNFIKGIDNLNKIQRLVIFDENFCGPIFNEIQNEIYPDLNKNIHNLNNYFANYGTVNNIMFIRNYFDYFVSRYSEYLRQYDIDKSFEEYINFKFSSSWFVHDQIDSYIIFEEVIKKNDSFLKYLTGIECNYKKFEPDSYTFRRKYSIEETQVLLNLSKLKYGGFRNHVIDLFDSVSDNFGSDFRDIHEEFFNQLSRKYKKDIQDSKKIFHLK